MTFRRLFLEHPGSLGESYLQHLGHALSFAGTLLVCALACLVHAVVPALCETTASRSVTRLHARMTSRRLDATSSDAASSRGSFA
jgi:hypothetical protein